MFLIKIFHFLKGYVILSVWGENRDAFLNRLLECGIKPIKTVMSGDRLILSLLLTDFFRLREINIPVKLHILKKCGIIFRIKRLKKRKIFLSGFILIFTLFIAGSNFVWDIRYEGVQSCDMAKLENAVRLAGLRPGVLKAKLPDGLDMKNIILNNTDGIAWAWVYINGTRATVCVREEILPPEVFDEDVPCDIIAIRSGILKSVITTHGRRIASQNQAVAPGDLIISGTYEFEDKPGYRVHAKGEVLAYTEHTRTHEFRQVYSYKKYTGKQRRLLTLHFFGKDLPLHMKNSIKFENYDLLVREYDLAFGKYYLGAGVQVQTAKEYITESEPISFDAAVSIAERTLEKEISRELLPGAVRLDKETTTESIDADTFRITVTMKFIEEIGTEKRTEEVTFIEPKTDRADG